MEGFRSTFAASALALFSGLLLVFAAVTVGATDYWITRFDLPNSADGRTQIFSINDSGQVIIINSRATVLYQNGQVSALPAPRKGIPSSGSRSTMMARCWAILPRSPLPIW